MATVRGEDSVSVPGLENALENALGRALPSALQVALPSALQVALPSALQVALPSALQPAVEKAMQPAVLQLTRLMENLTLANDDQVRRASNIDAVDFERLVTALEIVGPIIVDINGKTLEDGSVEKLLGEDIYWGEKYEEQERERYSQDIMKWMGQNRSLRWVNGNKATIRRKFEGLHFPVSSRNDFVLVLRSFGDLLGQGALLGVELKRKTLTRKSMRQAMVEFLLWGNASCFPFVQLITDMQRGGFAFYCTEVEPRFIIRQVLLANMSEVRTFVSQLGVALPANLGFDDANGNGLLFLPDDLNKPPRKKFKQT